MTAEYDHDSSPSRKVRLLYVLDFSDEDWQSAESESRQFPCQEYWPKTFPAVLEKFRQPLRLTNYKLSAQT